jgi:hypothetical protein
MNNTKTEKAKADEFDRFLSDGSAKPKWVYMSPWIWNGYWAIKPINPFVRFMGRRLGRLLHNKYIYWVGLPLYWVGGFKDAYPNTNLKQTDLYAGYLFENRDKE